MPLPVKPPRGGASSTALHDNVASEFSDITEKGTPIGADLLIIEDSAAAFVKKHITIANLPGTDHATPIGVHAAIVDSHHSKYLDSEAVTAMGVLGDTNPLHHARYTDAEAISAASETEFADNQFAVFDEADVTRILNLDLGTVATGTTRILVVPDADGTIALESYVDTADALLLPLAGGTMAGAITMGGFSIVNAGDIEIDSFTPASADISFFKDDGTTVSLLWDESDGRWEFKTPIRVDTTGRVLLLAGSQTGLYLDLFHNGVGVSARIGHETTTDDLLFRTYRGNIVIRADDIDDNTGASILFMADDSVGTPRDRYFIDGFSGDQSFYKDDGTTVSLLWDESDGRWEFKTSLVASEMIQVDISGTPSNWAHKIVSSSQNSGFWMNSGSPAVYLRNTSGNLNVVIRPDGGSYLNGGNLGIGQTGSSGKLHVSSSLPQPVLILDQGDVDEDFIKFIGTSDTNVDRALVDAANFTTPGTIAGWLKINIQDDQGTNPITDGDYYLPFYTAPAA